ncbi:MAG: hypothetical protein D6677_10365 [Calditrichaeota bacterium]|nr:MAG: hypothetical protein D6677_10365 [Calditrichota bacterium]
MRLLLILIVLSFPAHGQIGIGAAGTAGWPGAQASSQYDIRFQTGIGYRFFLRHDVAALADGRLHLKYTAGKSVHCTTLPLAGETAYRFSEFGIFLLWEKPNGLAEHVPFYFGAGASLLSLVSDNRYREDYSDENLMPHILYGVRWEWSEGFDAFAEVDIYYGRNGAGPETLPVTGVALTIGVTMYISEPAP